MNEIALPYFLARPAVDAPWPGVVVIHEGNGMTPQLLRVCQRLAAEGYAAIAPDLFFRVGGSGGADIPTMMGSIERGRTQRDIEEAAAILRSAGAGRIGVTGFCMGGLLTWRTAVSSPGFEAAVGFYGATISKELGEPRCPTLLFYGDTDEWVPATEIEAVRAQHPDTVVYEGAGHGFMRDGSPDFREAAATDAWNRLLAHFAAHLH